MNKGPEENKESRVRRGRKEKWEHKGRWALEERLDQQGLRVRMGFKERVEKQARKESVAPKDWKVGRDLQEQKGNQVIGDLKECLARGDCKDCADNQPIYQTLG